ncbi:MAG: hypothetical protein ABJV04_00295 [Aliiglaciecola sp.]|uniref:hypothetical protein n=1 Tax=Aliiglaciecola sp. TaxID=1872441 RepID=UPI0032968FD0
MIIRICILFFCGFCSIASAEQSLLDEAREAVVFVYGDEVQNRLYSDIDLDALEHAAGVMNKVIEQYDSPTQAELVYHQVLIHSIVILNFARIDLDQSVHLEQLENGLDKVDLFLKNNPNIADFGNLIFESGHIARFLLQDPHGAYKYWHLCAEQAHAGCMNILAFNYFSGGFGIRQDLEKSYYWHNQTYLTGTTFHCAGVYSARKLREMLFLFPEVSDNKQWRDWTPAILELIEQLEEEHADDSANMCGKAQVLMSSYLYDLYETNTEDLELLALAKKMFTALKIENNENLEVASYNLIGSADFFEKSIDLLRSIKDPFGMCNIAFSHLLYSQALKNTKHADAIFEMMLEQDAEVCNGFITTVELMRTKGSW